MMQIFSRKKAPPAVTVQRLPIRIHGSDRRVIALPFLSDRKWIFDIFEHVSRMSGSQVEDELEAVKRNFESRYEDVSECFEEHFSTAARHARWNKDLSASRRRLIGSYCTMEYSFESAALFNPSIVAHPDQEGVPEGSRRFVMSLRATGEGHVSSIVFQTGIIDELHNIAVDPSGSFSRRIRLAPDQEYRKDLFGRKLQEMGEYTDTVEAILADLPDTFSLSDLESATTSLRRTGHNLAQVEHAAESMTWLARSNYQLQIPDGDEISDLIIFPQSENESRGLEDLRLTRFTGEPGEDGKPGRVTYYGTYTAVSGHRILPMLMETTDFRRIQMHTLNGACVQNKGMALFPRRIDGHYAMCSRIDGHNIFLMLSDYIHFWESAKLLVAPKFPWEMRLIGNCGSPLATPAGWLLLTHGVGPMRRYCIGAVLLDRNDPFRIIGRLAEPLLSPTPGEREGNVPNVVYSCGGMLHHDRLFLPYAISDTATSIATVALDELIDRLLAEGA